MEAIWNFEISLIAGLQTSLASLAGFFQAATFLGSEEFFILVMPVLYWCVDTSVGLRIGVMLLLSGHFNGIFKVIFHSPRPFWYSPDIKALSTETSFGMPSGHAMNTTSIWGTAAVLARKKWFTILSVVVILLVGFSRLVVGMHFISDVLAGWVLGLILLLLFVKLDKPVSAWLVREKSLRVVLDRHYQHRRLDPHGIPGCGDHGAARVTGSMDTERDQGQPGRGANSV